MIEYTNLWVLQKDSVYGACVIFFSHWYLNEFKNVWKTFLRRPYDVQKTSLRHPGELLCLWLDKLKLEIFLRHLLCVSFCLSQKRTLWFVHYGCLLDVLCTFMDVSQNIGDSPETSFVRSMIVLDIYDHCIKKIHKFLWRIVISL